MDWMNAAELATLVSRVRRWRPTGSTDRQLPLFRVDDMDEGRELLARVLRVQRSAGHVTGFNWDALRAEALGGIWGRCASEIRIDGSPLWVLQAELSR